LLSTHPAPSDTPPTTSPPSRGSLAAAKAGLLRTSRPLFVCVHRISSSNSGRQQIERECELIILHEIEAKTVDTAVCLTATELHTAQVRVARVYGVGALCHKCIPTALLCLRSV
jgi:hypothetical protein